MVGEGMEIGQINHMRRYSVGVAGLVVTQLLWLGWFDSITAHNGTSLQRLIQTGPLLPL